MRPRGIPSSVMRFKAAHLALSSVTCLRHWRALSLPEKITLSRIVAVPTDIVSVELAHAARQQNVSRQ